MKDPSRKPSHPFLLESLYREMAAHVTKGDLSNPDTVMAPIVNMYLQQRDELFSQARERTTSEAERTTLDEEREKPWWRLMPLTLPPFRPNHEFSLAYAVYRLMSNGNMVFKIGPELSTALFNTDFEVKMGELRFPSDTFVIYYEDSSIPVYGSTLKWLFCDRIEYTADRKELRIVYGYIDKDGDYANSGFQLFNYQSDVVVVSDELFAQLEDEKVSRLSLMEVTEEHRNNSRNVTTALFNFLLYLGAVGDQTPVSPPDNVDRLKRLTNPKKRRRLEQEIENQTIFRYTYVGRSYESRLSEDERGSGGRSDHLSHRVLVRGHWRHQWTGSQRDSEGNRVAGTSQKLIWIEPYWKGPDERDEKTTVRVVR